MNATVPYNFVPLASKIFFPDWADKISHDIPFEDGEDGYIDLTIENLSPLFTRNGTAKNATEEEKSFSSHIMTSDGNRKYFIPGTTLKGCFRSVMEILSFAKMQQFNDDSFGMVRDFDTKKTDNKEYIKLMNGTSCGWLQQNEDSYTIIECKSGIVKISHNDILSEFPSFNKGRNHATAEIKQKSLSADSTFGYPEINREDGSYQVVCTGYMKGKEHEYLFSCDVKDPVNVDIDVIKAFESVHKNTAYYGGKNGKGVFLKDRLHKGIAIPVFFTKENEKVSAIGITKNFRYPYKTSVSVAVRNSYTSIQNYENELRKIDLTEAIFGYSTKDSSLKGRVVFSHAFCDAVIPDSSLVKERGVLGQPSASYYPFYLKQKNAPYKSYQDSTVEIAGRKRYRITQNNSYNHLSSPNGNENVCSTLRLIPSGNVFKCRIILHNMRPMEIGALLSAITFHKNPDTYHNIGMAKGFGFGKIKLQVNLNGLKYEEEDYLKAFEYMLMEDDIHLAKEPSVKTLIAIAQDCHDLSSMKYMGLKDYAELKKVCNFTLLSELDPSVKTYVSTAEFLERQREKKKKLEDEIFKKQQEEEKENRKKEDIETADNLYESAKKCLAVGLIQESLSNIQKAIAIYSCYNIQKEEAEEIRAKCNAILQSKKEIPLDELLAKITSIGNLCGTMKKWVKNNTLGDNELILLKEKILGMQLKNLSKDMNSKKKDWQKSIGMESSARLFELLGI